MTCATLRGDSVPAAAQLTRLCSLHIESTTTVHLQPLSALQHLTELRVPSGPASGLKHLPALHSLCVHPRHPSDMRSLSRQTGLTSLILHAAASRFCVGCEIDKWCAADYASLASLTGLQELRLLSYHCTQMGGASTLAGGCGLRRLDLTFESCGDCWDCYADFDSCGLTSLTQLREVCLRDMGHELELEALDVLFMPSLQKLVLQKPSPFSGEDEFPAIRVPTLEVVFVDQSWGIIQDVLSDLTAVNRTARREQQDTFSVLRLSGWPAISAPEGLDTGIQNNLSRLVRHGVRIESASVTEPGSYQVFQRPQLPPEAAAEESEQSSSGED